MLKYIGVAGVVAFLLLTAGWVVEASAESCQRILVIEAPENKAAISSWNNLKKVLGKVKLNYMVMGSESDALPGELAKLGPQDLVILAMNDYAGLSCQSRLVKFVADGGKVFLPVLGGDSPIILNLAGVVDVKGTLQTTDFRLRNPLFPGFELSSRKQLDMRSESLSVTLDKNAQVIAEDSHKLPLAWRFYFGKGQVVAVNSQLLLNANLSGLLLQLASLADDYFVTTIFNAKVVFIDDFPFPVPNGSEFVITSNYDGRSYEEFYRDIWWPQIKELAVKYHLRYTCLALGNYENSVKMPPIELSSKIKDGIRYYGMDIIKSGHELGIHGYNHAPLVLSANSAELKEINYLPWASEADMESSLRSLKRTLTECLGPREYFSYVPPMNMMSKAGKQAVLNVFPSVRCLAGLGDTTAAEPVLTQEIGADPDFPSVYALPRFSDGYLVRDNDMWDIYNNIAYFGLFSHFIHPDDLMDGERCGNKNWQELYESLDGTIGAISERFPWMRGMSAQEFVTERFRTEKIKVYASRSGGMITLKYEGGEGPLFHYLRLNDGHKVKSVTNGRAVQIGQISGLYMVEGAKSPVQIVLE